MPSGDVPAGYLPRAVLYWTGFHLRRNLRKRSFKLWAVAFVLGILGAQFAARVNPETLARAVVLGIVFLVWARASLVVFALFYNNEMPNLSGFLEQIIKLENIEFLTVYFCIGLLFATIAFGVSVVSIPLMLDRNQDAVTAMLASAGALIRNPVTMMAWAASIVVMTIIGFMTFHIGLVVVMPLVGHASWHAYRDLIEPLPAK